MLKITGVGEKIKAKLKTKAILETSFRIKTRKIDTKKPLHLVKALEKTTANLFLPILTNKEF